MALYTQCFQHECMNRGVFELWHAWPDEDGSRVEYWRGVEGNGGIVFERDPEGQPIRSQWFPTPGQAINSLIRDRFRVPGVASQPGAVGPVF